jgi:redox-sensitive bicupin YhaK (pirin superfamily)
MTAGRGVIHSELPEQEDGRMEGFQLWLNLAAKHKLRAPVSRHPERGDTGVHHTRRRARHRRAQSRH